MNCRQALMLIDKVVDGMASEYERRLLDFHMLGCGSCRQEFELTKDISRLTRGLSQPLPPPDLEDMIRQRIAEQRKSEASRGRMLKRAAVGLPFAAALILVFTLHSGGGTVAPGDSPGSQAFASEAAKVHRTRILSKQDVSVTPLSGYTRSANPISF